MIIDGKKIAEITIKNPEDEIIAVLTDKEAQVQQGYNVSVVLDTSPGPNAIAHAGDVLYYTDNPDQKYIVTQADDKFFVMVPVTVNQDTEEIKYDNIHQRVYPNNFKTGTLDDYCIGLEYRGSNDGNS